MTLWQPSSRGSEVFTTKIPKGEYRIRRMPWSSDPRYVMSNEPDRNSKWHYAVRKAWIGDKGSYLGSIEGPACGARLGSAWGRTVTSEQPYPDLICQNCAKLRKPLVHDVQEGV